MINKYAKINSDNIVENVILCEDSVVTELSGQYIKVTELTKDAHEGATWDSENGIFIKVKTYPSWLWNDELSTWESPKGPCPDVFTKIWDEDSQEWINRV